MPARHLLPLKDSTVARKGQSELLYMVELRCETEELGSKLMLLSQESVIHGRISSDQQWVDPY